MVKKVKEYQTLISALTLAAVVAGAALTVSYRAGEMVSQHHQIIEAQGQMLRMIQDKCR